MVEVNEASKLVAQALALLKCYFEDTGPESGIMVALDLLEQALVKLTDAI